MSQLSQGKAGGLHCGQVDSACRGPREPSEYGELELLQLGPEVQGGEWEESTGRSRPARDQGQPGERGRLRQKCKCSACWH